MPVFRGFPLLSPFWWGREGLGCWIIEVATELPASSVLRFFVTAVGPFDFRGETVVGALAVSVTPTFCGLSFFWIDFFPVLGVPSESEPLLKSELESFADVELPDDSESLSLSSELSMEGRVWLDPAGERDLCTDEVVISRTATAFGVGGASDSKSESGFDESVGIIVSQGLRVEENTHLRILI